MKFNRKTFFDNYRKFFDSINQSQVEAIEFLLDAFEKQTVIQAIPQIAYCFATIAHETAWTFKPIREYRARVGSKGRANQDRYWLSGYYGRGYVQLTWKSNYQTMSRLTGLDLVSYPDKALTDVVAFQILIIGMSQGVFTSKKLSDYIYANKKDYVGARKIINGTDKAAQIAGYAKAFEACLNKSFVKNQANQPTEPTECETAEETKRIRIVDEAKGYVVEETATAQTVNEQTVTETVQVIEPEKQGIFAKLTGGITALLSGTFLVGIFEKFGNISLSQTVLVLLIVAIVIGFVGFCFWAVLDAWKAKTRLALEIEAKTRTDRKDLEWIKK